MNTLAPTLAKPDISEVSALPRSLVLDAFRGLTVLLMLLVNNLALDASAPAQLVHAPWGGEVRLADLVFPWFLFGVGVSIPLAWASATRQGLGLGGWIKKALGRTLALSLFGLLLTSAVARTPVFSLGVLQLIALAFLVGALIYPFPRWIRLGTVAVLLLGYWAAIEYIPVPGRGVGVFEEGQNLLLHLNQNYLSPLGLRGILSVIPTAALVLMAAGVGELLRAKLLPIHRGLWLLGLGLGLSLLGYLWSLDLEFNKPYWTPSYILLGAGTGAAMLGVLTLLEIALGRWWAFPLKVFGSNALLAYVAPILIKVWILQGWQMAGQNLQGWFLSSLKGAYGSVAGGWLYTLAYIGIWWLVLFWFYRKRIFLRV